MAYQKDWNVTRRPPRRSDPRGPDHSTLQIQRGIRVRTGQDPMSAYKKLARQLKESGFFDELRTREAYVKPSTKRKNAASRATARERKRQYRQQSKWGPIPTQIPQRKKNKGKSSKRKRFMIDLGKPKKIKRKDRKRTNA